MPIRRPALLIAAAAAAALATPTPLPLLPAASAAGQTAKGEPVAETIVFVRNLSPTEAVAQFKHTYRAHGKPGAASLPQGVFSLKPDEKKGVVYVKGTREGIKTVMRLMPLLDVAPRQVEVRAKILAVRFGPDGSRQEQVLQAPTVLTLVNTPGEVKVGRAASAQQTQLAFTPRLNDSGDEVTLRVKFGMVWEDGTSDGIERAVVLRSGQKQRVAGLANVKDSKLREAVALGKVPTRWPSPFTAYYVDAEAAEVKNPPKGAATP